jgi:hypothetical protein
MPDDEMKRCAITPALIRISTGVEDPVDLIANLEQALEGVPARRSRSFPECSCPIRAA